jgi:hypothetical protein
LCGVESDASPSTAEKEAAMKYAIKADKHKVAIDVGDVGVKKDAALVSFEACAEGYCTCPTNEYTKLTAIEVEAKADGIAIRLTPKPGEAIDVSEIAKCLDHTAKTIG